MDSTAPAGRIENEVTDLLWAAHTTKFTKPI